MFVLKSETPYSKRCGRGVGIPNSECFVLKSAQPFGLICFVLGSAFSSGIPLVFTRGVYSCFRRFLIRIVSSRFPRFLIRLFRRDKPTFLTRVVSSRVPPFATRMLLPDIRVFSLNGTSRNPILKDAYRQAAVVTPYRAHHHVVQALSHMRSARRFLTQMQCHTVYVQQWPHHI